MTTIDLGEIGIHVEEYGAGDPLVLLMGLGGEGGLCSPISKYTKNILVALPSTIGESGVLQSLPGPIRFRCWQLILLL
jgi:hypothetical protein